MNESEIRSAIATAGFVFVGTIEQTGAATMASVPVDEHTLTVRVDEVVKAPPRFGNYGGQQVTVQTTEPAVVEVGAQRLYFSDVWQVGASAAVLAAAETAADPEAVATAHDAVAAEPARVLAARADDSGLIIAGHVVEIVDLPHTGPISEHHPVWKDAVVHVDSVEKGELGNTPSVRIRFAASDDVRWHHAPKFSVGQRGAWLLSDSSITTAALTASGAMAASEFTVTDPHAFVADDDVDRLRGLIA